MERIQDLRVEVFTIPTETPESDGTLQWDETTLVLVHARCGRATGLGYTYADTSTARLIEDKLKPQVVGCDALSIAGPNARMRSSLRNLGCAGIAAMAISAVDVALWDLKARLLEVPLVQLLGQVRDAANIYGSGGFTSYTPDQLCEQLSGWTSAGIERVKMKVGREPSRDVERVQRAGECIGRQAELFVDANGAYARKQALAMAEQFAELGVTWFEEPVPSADLDGLRLLRDRSPAGMEIAAGEYGYQLIDFKGLVSHGAVDCLQADITRCGGISGFLDVAALCRATQMPLSTHCAPSLHVAVGCSVECLRHLEYFFDHVRIEELLFDGVLRPRGGRLMPDLSRPGLGLEFKSSDARAYAVPNW